MVDVAKLKIVADTSDLKRGKQDLQAFRQEGGKTETQMGRTGRATGGFVKNMSPANQQAMKNFAFQLNQIGQQGAVTGNYLGALSIQLPDMLTSFGFLGIMLGGVTAVAGPAVLSLLSVGGAANDLQDQVDALTDAVDAYRSSSSAMRMSANELEDAFGSQSAAIQRALAFQNELARADALRELEAGIASVTEAYGGLSRSEMVAYDTTRGFWASMFDKSPVGLVREIENTLYTIREELDLTEGQAASLVLGLEALANAEGLDAQIQAGSNLNDIFVQIYGNAESIPEALRPLATATAEAAVQAARIVAADEAAEIARQRNLVTAQELVAAVGQEAELRTAIAQYGQDSAQVAELRLERERQILDAKLDELGITGQVKEELIAGAIAALEVALNSESAAAGIAAAAAEATQMANEIQRAVNGMINLRAQGVASLRQSELRLQFRDDPVGLAGAMAGERFDTRSETLRANAPDGQLEYLRQEREAYVANAEATEQNRQALIAWQQEQARAAAGTGGRRPRTSGGGGGSRGQSEAERKHQERLREAERIYRSTRTAAEQYASELNDLNELHQLGYLDADAHARATEALSDELGLSAPIAARFAQQIAALNTKLAAGETTNEEYAASLQGLQAQMDSMGDLPTIEQGIQSISDAMAQAIVSGENLGEAFSRVLDQIAADILSSGIKMLLTDLFTPAGGGGGGGFLGSLFAGLFDKGGNIPTGKVGIAGENGPELIRGPAHVTSTAATARLLGGASQGGDLGVDVRVFVDDDGNWQAKVENIATTQATEVTRAGLEHYDRNVAPGRHTQIASDPRRRG